MACLTDLSTELILLITSHLLATEKSTFARVSKRLHEIVNPLLYTDIYDPSIPLLLRTVLRSDTLANYIHRITFDERDGIETIASGVRKLSHKGFSDLLTVMEDLELYRSIAWIKPLTTQEYWSHMLVEDQVTAYQILLLSQLRNLTTLSLAYSYHTGITMLVTMFRSALRLNTSTTGLSSFNHHRKVDQYVDNPLGDLAMHRGVSPGLHDVLPFSSSHAFQDLQTVMPKDCDHAPWPIDLPLASTLTKLCLKRSHANEEILGTLLAVTSNLKHLEYYYMCEIFPDDVDPSQYLDCAALKAALRHVKTTLECLHIAVQFYSWVDTWGMEPAPTFGIKGILQSLGDFERIVDLEVPHVLLWGMDPRMTVSPAGNLPPNVRSLCLRDDMAQFEVYRWSSEAVLECLQEFVRECSRQHPDMKTLQLILSDSRKDWGEPSLAKFYYMCQGAGISPQVGW